MYSQYEKFKQSNVWKTQEMPQNNTTQGFLVFKWIVKLKPMTDRTPVQPGLNLTHSRGWLDRGRTGV